MVLTSSIVSSCFDSTANVKLLLSEVELEYHSLPSMYVGVLSILLACYYKSIDAQVTWCPLSCSYTLKKPRGKGISLISVKVSNIKVLSLALFWRKILEQMFFRSQSSVIIRLVISGHNQTWDYFRISENSELIYSFSQEHSYKI